MKNWETLQDGGSGTWVYSRKVGPLAWVFLQVMDMVDACGSEADYYFHGDVSVIDLKDLPPDQIGKALRSCSAEDWIFDLPKEKRFLVMAQVCHEYCRAPLWQGESPAINKEHNKDWQWNVPGDTSPTFLRLRAAARRWAEESLLDEENRNQLLDSTVVNAIGQSAREYSRGTEGLWSKLREIKGSENATPEQKLVLQMYASAGNTLGAGPVPEDLRSGEG